MCAHGFFNNSKKFWRLIKKSLNILRRAKKIWKLFSGKCSTHTSLQTRIIIKPKKNRINPHKTPKFSDVIAIEGNRRAFEAVSLKNRPEICVKKSDPQNAVKLQDQIAIKRAFLEK